MPTHSKSHPSHTSILSTPVSTSSSSSSVAQLSRELSTQLDLGHSLPSPAAAPAPHPRRSAPRLYLLLSLLQYRVVQERMRLAVVDVDDPTDRAAPSPATSSPAAPAESTAKLFECYRLGTRLSFRCTRDAQRR